MRVCGTAPTYAGGNSPPRARHSLAGVPGLGDGYPHGPKPILARLHMPTGVVLQDEPWDTEKGCAHPHCKVFSN